MLVTVTGKVVKVQEREYTDKDNVRQYTWDAWLAASDPTRAADRISGPSSLGVPREGDMVVIDANVTPQSGKFGAYLRVWARSLDLSDSASKVA